MKKLRVTVEGKTYEVLVELLDEGTTPSVPAAQPVRPGAAPAPPTPPSPPRSAAGAGDVVSPLAGKVVTIDVKVGQTLTEGTQVATIEAMKMNTYLYASRAGTVAAVLANPGDNVEEGAPIVRLS